MSDYEHSHGNVERHVGLDDGSHATVFGEREESSVAHVDPRTGVGSRRYSKRSTACS